MRDSLEIQIAGNSISKFLSYEADSNILTPADAFQCKLGGLTDGEMEAIKTGERWTLLVNEVVEMRGIIDKKTVSYDRGKREVSLEGRDYMGLLVDSSATEHVTINKTTLKDLAVRLLKNVPYIDKSDIKYSIEKAEGYQVKKKKEKAEEKGLFYDLINQSQPEAGQAIFEILSAHAQKKGLIFWCNPDGQLIFGEIKKEGPAEFWFYIQTKDRKRNNIISAKLTDDISKRYSKVTVVGQVQGSDVFNPGDHTISKTAADNNFHFYKPLILQASVESEKAAEFQAKWELKKREVEGWQVEITVAGHRQENSGNYRANSVCYIKDELLGLNGNYLILGRKFTMNRTEGPRTILTIGRLTEGYTVQ